jgi:hypothetical protein
MSFVFVFVFALAALAAAAACTRSRVTVTDGEDASGAGGEGGNAAEGVTSPAATGNSSATGRGGADDTSSSGGAGQVSAMGGASTTSAGGSGAEGGAADSECRPAEVCAPSPPDGWSGPAAVSGLDDPPSCPVDYPTLAFDAGSEVSADNGCACACGDLEGTCGTSIELSSYSSEDCSGTPSVTEAFAAQCYGFETAASVAFRTQPPATTSCAPGTVTPALGTPEFSDPVRACVGAASQGMCSGGDCLALGETPFDDGLCIFRAGEHDCPASYPARSELFEDLVDDRECPTTCDCEPEGGDCTLAAAVRSGNCEGNLAGFVSLTSVEPPECVLSATNPNSFLRAEATPAFAPADGDCIGQDPTPSGGITRLSMLTLCCLE